jgi:uncharacterized iron-regulated membrane protein
MRKILFWLHLAAGVTAGSIIFIMCVTGAALTYERQINTWLDLRGVHITPSARGVGRLSAEALLGRIREQRAVNPSALTVHSGAAEPVEVSMGRQGTLYADPYTGLILAQSGGLGATGGARAFFRSMENWHRWLGAVGGPGPGGPAGAQAGPFSRDTGKYIADAANLVFFLILLSGLYLWLPRKFTWQHVRPALLFRRGLSGKAREWNWHNVIGVWAWLPLLLIVGSGVIMSYPWASNLLYTVTGSPLPSFPAGPGGGRGPGPGGPATGRGAIGAGVPFGFGGGAPANWDGLDPAMARAEQQVPGWKSIRVQGSANPDAPWNFSIDAGYGGQPQLRGTLLVSRTGEIRNWTDFSSGSTGQKLRNLARFTHTGETLGVWGQTIAGAVAVGGSFMVYTGFAMALRRLLGQMRRREREQDSEKVLPVGQAV